jgi:hypothetical protein
MAATKKTAKKKSSAKKKSAARKGSSGRGKKSAGPLIEVARKIGSTLGEVNVAVRSRISKLSGGGETPGDE